MTNPQENSHVHQIAFVPDLDPLLHPTENPLSETERISLEPGVKSDPQTADLLWKQLDAWAGQLADPERRDEARQRHVARMIASLRMKILLHERRRDQALLGGDSHLALVVDRMLLTDSRRLEGILREHREGDRRGARTVHISAVAIGNRPEVHVVASRTE
ncbi:MAG: hypothetical protein EPO40_21920 [Myxococcaceae bacterium]|nr:MAG: hypothetical protein EPO40_21920 [Myxococcaceae bacterium]